MRKTFLNNFKQLASIKSMIISSNTLTAYFWQYSEINDPYEGKRSTFPPLNDEDKKEFLSHLNIGFDQSDTKLILEKLEYVTRPDSHAELTIELSKVPFKTPRWLDDPSEYFGWPKTSFNNLIIRNTPDKSTVRLDYDKLTVEFNFTREKLYELFTRIYVCNTIYACSFDNVIAVQLETETGLTERELIFWGVIGKEPIHY